MMSFVFSKVAFNAGSVTDKFLTLFMNLINCTAALNSFFNALGFKFIYKQNNAKYCKSLWTL